MTLRDFIIESWDIEGEKINATECARIEKLVRNWLKQDLSLDSFLILFAQVFELRNRLRTQYGMDVQVGGHIAPLGGPDIETKLEQLIEKASDLTAYELYCSFEYLHPFTDGNGRMGRFLWLHRMEGNVNLLFLRAFHYQSLENWDNGG